MPPPFRLPGFPGLPTARSLEPVAAPPREVAPAQPPAALPMSALLARPYASEPMLSHGGSAPARAPIDRAALYGTQPTAPAALRDVAPATLDAWAQAAEGPGPAAAEPYVAPVRAPVPPPPMLGSFAGGRYDLSAPQASPIAMPDPSADLAAPARAAGPVRLVGGPRRPAAPAAPPAEFDSLGRPLAPAYIDQMTQQGPAPLRTPQDSGLDRQLRALDEQRQLEQRRAEMLARQGADVADAEEGYRQQADALEAQRRDADGRARESYDNAIRRVEAMHVDPSRWYRQQGAVGTLASALAVGLGALGESLGGGPNIALQQINRAIDADLQAQDRDISTATQSAEQRRGLLHEVRQDFLSRQAALEATRAQMLREMAARAESEAAMHGSAEAAANGRVMRDQLIAGSEAAAAQAQIEEARTQLELRRTLARTQILEAQAMRDQRRAMGVGGPAAPRPVTSAQITAAHQLQASGIDPETARQATGMPFVLPQAPITTEQRSALDALDASLREVEGMIPADTSQDVPGVGIIDSNLPSFLQSDEGQRMRMALRNVTDLLGRLRSGAAISEDEFTNFMGMVEGAGTERDLRIGVSQIRSELASRLGNGGRRQSAAGAADAAVSAAGLRQVE